ncbi:MAG: hydrolase [Ruminococcaceae bacterium]|jgi:hypothetical protein|nr:hydrolase [Oscillospiraceae bacterium]
MSESVDKFIEAYNANIQRQGADKLLAWLKTTDFFTAPASTRFHGAHEGGLVEHVLNVFHELSDEYDWYIKKALSNTDDAKMNAESIAICGLLHDVCKANFYSVSMRNVKNDETGQWEKQPFYQVADQFPYGHGEKSVFLIERFMRLHVDEAVAIRWHMGGFDDAVRGGCFAEGDAYDKYPLALLLHIADMKATHLDESTL